MIASAVLIVALWLQDDARPDRAAIDAAIRKGADWLLANGKPAPAPGDQLKPSADPLGRGFQGARELVLLALHHAGPRDRNPFFDELFAEMLGGRLEHTYRVSVQAMLLEQMDRVRHQDRIRQCAQFLVDNQCVNGQWDYGAETDTAADKPTTGKVASGPAKKISIRKRREGARAGDNSNSQYAALGLRACSDAGIELPKDVIERALGRWRSMRVGDGWGYSHSGVLKEECGSMTAGAITSILIYDSLLGADGKADDHANRGLRWLQDHWTVMENPGRPKHDPHLLYYLYGLERVGMIAGTRHIGTHDWYAEGAKQLLDSQKPDGSWLGIVMPDGSKPSAIYPQAVDTCFAILFLSRATRPLVESVDPKKK